MKYLLALLLCSTVHAGIMDNPDPVEARRQRAECSRRCEVYSDAQQRGACVERCDVPEPTELEPDPRFAWTRPTGSTLNRATLDAIQRHASRLYGPTWNPPPCESWWACGGAADVACAANVAAGAHALMAVWTDESLERGRTSCLVVCSQGTPIQSTCDQPPIDGCSMDDLMPCGRCAPWTEHCARWCEDNPGRCG